MNKFKLGSWKVEPNKSLLTSDNGKEVRIEPLNMALLCYFAKHPVDPISREKLIEDVWDNKVVTDHAVYKTINQLRKYLASDGDSQDYLKTIPKKGYSLVAPLEEIVEASPKDVINLKFEATSANGFTKWFYKHPVLHTLGLLIVAGIFIWNLGLNTWWYKNQQPVYNNLSVLAQIDGVLDQAIPSPNEKLLAVTSYGDSDVNNRKIFLLNLESQEVSQLTDGIHDFSEISWSSEGNYLVASRKPISSMNDEYCDLVLLELSKDFSRLKSQKEVTSCSPRGSSAQFDEESEMVYYNFAQSNIVPSSLYSYSLRTKEIELLTNPGSAVWGDWSVRLSPDKSKLLFMRVYEEASEIFLYNLKTKKEQFLFKFIGYPDELSWAGNNEKIIYQPNNNQVVLYSIVDKFHKTIITKEDSIVSSFHSLASDSIYTVSRLNDIEIVQFDIKHPQKAKVVNSSKAMEFSGIYANTSDNYAFVSKRSGSWQLWLQTNKQLKMLTNNDSDGVIFTPTWSFDDKQIVFNLGGAIYAYDFEKDETLEIYAEEDVYLQNPFWSSDAKSIYFTKLVADTNQIFKLELKNKTIKQITSDGGYAGAISLSNNALYLVKDEQFGLWRLDLSNLEEIKINDIASNEDQEFIHTVEDGLYFSNLKGYLKSLYFVDYETHTTRKVVDFISRDVAGFSVNHTQEKVLTTVTHASNANLTIYRP